MTSQNLLKVLTLLSLLATAVATVIWYQTGEAPDPWLIRGAASAFAAALVVGLVSPETRPRIMLRFLTALFALVALIAFAADFSRAGSKAGPEDAGFASTSLLEHVSTFAPSLLASVKASITRLAGASAWDPVLTSVLDFPAFLIFAILAVLCGYAGRPRREVHIYVN